MKAASKLKAAVKHFVQYIRKTVIYCTKINQKTKSNASFLLIYSFDNSFFGQTKIFCQEYNVKENPNRAQIATPSLSMGTL